MARIVAPAADVDPAERAVAGVPTGAFAEGVGGLDDEVGSLQPLAKLLHMIIMRP